MKIVKANAELLDVSGLHPYQIIERIGRICYKSEDNIKEGSAVKFVQAMRKNKHHAMLEHAHVFLFLDSTVGEILKSVIREDNSLAGYLNITDLKYYAAGYTHLLLVSGSFRAFIDFFDGIKYPEDDAAKAEETRKLVNTMTEILGSEYPEIFYTENPTNNHSHSCILNRESFIGFIKSNCRNSSYILQKHLPHTVIFTCDRGVSHEFVRHRPASFAQESTRYCNYIKDKFGSEITVIEPCFFTDPERKVTYDAWVRSCEVAEKEYFNILEAGGTPQEARDVLPTSTKTEIAITATEKEWRHIINLRYHGVTGAPHPQMVEVMTIAYPFLMEISEGRVDHKYDPCVDAVVADPDEFTLRIKKLSDTAVLPTRGSDGAAGFDLYADSVEGEFSTYTAEDGTTRIVCAGGTNVTVNTGIAMAIPKGYVGLIFARSGLACKAGLRPANCVGVIDEDYRGPIKVVLHNDIDFTNCQLTFKIDDNNNVSVDDNPFINDFSEFALHDRVAQIVFVKYEAFRLMEVENLDETDRGEGGFGSTGLK